MKTRPSILILGTDHFNNPDNGDMFKTQTNDILSDHRQKEMDSVIKGLKHFNPTKIAIEALPEYADEWNDNYRFFREGRYKLTADERHQLGFKLAYEMDHREIFCVDWNDPGSSIPDVGGWAQKHDSEAFEWLMKNGEEMKKKLEKNFREQTLSEFLCFLNGEEFMRFNEELYMRMARIGTEEEPVGAQWTAQYWHFRNMIIFKRLSELAEYPDERILTIYGAGHLNLLHQFFRESHQFNIEPVQKYLK